MTQLVFMEGFEHIPLREQAAVAETHSASDALGAIDDIYTAVVLDADYEPGDEGRFFPEVFAGAVKVYEHETGRSLSPEEVYVIEQAIRADCTLLAKHGFEEPLFDENEAER